MNFKLNHYYTIYFSIFTTFLKFSLCLLSDKSVFPDTDEKNYKSEISTEEILRRRKLVEPYVTNIVEKQRDWIDTYQSIPVINEIPSKIKFESEDYISKKSIVNNDIPPKDDKQQKIEKDWPPSHQLNSDSGKREILPDFVTKSPPELLHRHKIVENFDSELSNLGKGIETTDHLNSKDINQDISSYNCDGINNMVSNTKCNIKADEDISEVILESALPEFTKIEKVRIESSYSTTNNDKKDVSPDMKMNSVSSKNIITAESGKGNINSDLLDNFNMEKLDESVYLNSENNKHDILHSNLKPENIDSKNKFTRNEADDSLSQYKIKDVPLLKPTDTKKDTAENQFLPIQVEKDGLSSSYKLEVSEFSIETEKIYQTMNKILNNRNSESVETEEASEASKLENYHNDAEEGKDVFTDYKFKIISEDTLPPLKLSSNSEERLQRKKLVSSFVSSINEGRENWKETYEYSKEDTDSEEIQEYLNSNFNRDRNAYDLHKPGQNAQNNIFQRVYDQERLFISRWLKKLLNKFDNFLEVEHITVNFLFTADVIKEMKNISNHKNFDMTDADKLISDLISNAVVQSRSNLSGFFNISASVGFYVVVGIVLLVTFYFILLHYRIFRLILIILICIMWHGYKMYQEKVAEKHAVLAGSSPAYCDSILNKESGLFAHVKEYFRYQAYSDHCKKYFEALMIDPLSELSLSIIVSDFVSATFFQLFRPMGRALNVFVKDLFFDLSFLKAFYLILLIIIFITFCIICVLIYNNYKLNFPLFMGSIEPSVTPVGSRVEDLALEPNANNKSALKCKVSKKYITVVCNTKDHSSLMLYKNSSMLTRRYSF